ncbi:MAG: hypothetical protein Kow0029_12590 [Candidatus Rifleibacteriota bacterium]
MQTNIDITQAFIETPDGVLSIHQISKKLHLPYGTAYNRIHSLNKIGIVQILPQGKAKLCALNPDNPMTACLLALGASQKNDHFTRKNLEAGLILKKIIKSIYEIGKDSLIAAILLTPDALKIAAGESLHSSHNEVSIKQETSLDFFYITNSNGFAENKAEAILSTLIPPGVPIKATSMSVDRETLLGMLTENENEAGLAAYSMLNDGIILFGFENFYQIVLEAFARKLSG